VVVSPSGRGTGAAGPGALGLFVRNAPVRNQLIVQAGRWRMELTLNPGEERTLSIPLAPGHRASEVRFETTAGFRPSDVEPGSRDARFLGVWVEVRSEK
jgi:hypothetical protein